MRRISKKITSSQWYLNEIRKKTLSIAHLMIITGLSDEQKNNVEEGCETKLVLEKIVGFHSLIKLLEDPVKHRAMQDLLSILQITNPSLTKGE